MTKQQQIEIEAAAFRGLVEHLRQRTDVQNIDLMNLAGFCRNCLSKWYLAEAKNQGLEMDYAAAQKAVYGMDIKEWKANYQTEASAEQQEKFEQTKPLHAKISGHT
ncbi:MAG: DUF1244 domain-containing protein [Gammaproteobacteria bacterium]|nr:DUF1244 domain-containing protein [Gammaproteobacteria bacterium]